MIGRLKRRGVQRRSWRGARLLALGLTLAGGLVGGVGAVHAQEDSPLTGIHFSPARFTMRIDNVYSADETGEMVERRASSVLLLRIASEPGYYPLRCESVTATRVVTDSGEELKPMRSMTSYKFVHDWQYPVAQRSGGRVNPGAAVTFALPSRHFERTLSLQAQAKVLYAQGEPEILEVKLDQSIWGKRVANPSIPGLYFIFTQPDSGRRSTSRSVDIEFPLAYEHHLYSLTFHDAQGRELKASPSGSTRHRPTGSESRRFNVQTRDEMTVRLEMFPQVRTGMFPVHFENLPILLTAEQLEKNLDQSRRDRAARQSGAVEGGKVIRMRSTPRK